jgi:hypothetical protein
MSLRVVMLLKDINGTAKRSNYLQDETGRLCMFYLAPGHHMLTIFATWFNPNSRAYALSIIIFTNLLVLVALFTAGFLLCSGMSIL